VELKGTGSRVVVGANHTFISANREDACFRRLVDDVVLRLLLRAVQKSRELICTSVIICTNHSLVSVSREDVLPFLPTISRWRSTQTFAAVQISRKLIYTSQYYDNSEFSDKANVIDSHKIRPEPIHWTSEILYEAE